MSDLQKAYDDLQVKEHGDGTATYKGYRYTRARSAYMRRAKDLGTHTKKEWETLVAYYNWKCCCCGSEVIGSPTKDHIVPIREMGSDSIDNLQPLCRQCNLLKGNRTINFRIDD